MFRIMFHSPRIAPNTGNAIRMVAATGCELHLVEPLGFALSEPKQRRAGLDAGHLLRRTAHVQIDDVRPGVQILPVDFLHHFRTGEAEEVVSPL